FIYLRPEYSERSGKTLGRAIEEAYNNGFLGENILGMLFDFDLHIHIGGGSYVCGEETALIESMEGGIGRPRLPLNRGLWNQPTLVNNVETLSNIPIIINIGAESFASIGTPESPGTKLFSISGCVKKPGIYELPMGTHLRDMIFYHAGGIRDDRALKAVFPGGISTPILPAREIDSPMDYSSLQKYGSKLGSGAVLVLDEDVCMVKVALRAMEFFERESCGKCTPCREGIAWLRKILKRIEHGDADNKDVKLLMDVAKNICGKSFCDLGDGAALMLMSILKHFKDEFIKHIDKKRCPFG
ncbi:MAG: NADH-quinone oxidoreductase subunit F, partial [Nitrospirae bacterium]